MKIVSATDLFRNQIIAKLLLVLLFFSIAIYLWICNNETIINISDFSREQTFNFSTDPSKQVSVIKYNLNGEINDKVEIYGLNNDHHFVSGKIDSTFYVDYFINSAVLIMNPLKETKGNLQIKLGLYQLII